MVAISQHEELLFITAEAEIGIVGRDQVYLNNNIYIYRIYLFIILAVFNVEI